MIVGGLAAGLLAGTASVSAAQAGDLDAFCAKRVELNSVQKKKLLLAGLGEMVDFAPPEILPALTDLRDAFAEEGFGAFETETEAVAALDEFVYDNCPGAKVEITAVDYEYLDAPETLAPGLTNVKLINDAPKEDHEIGIVRLRPEAEGRDIEKLLALSDKKAEKFVDLESGAGTFAPAGAAGYTLIELEPGTYVYACFIPVGGKKKGEPHWTEGMYGTFTVE
ncbi:MAG: hypothetical protein R6X23_12645 [Acidimicrobiia bacterium]